MHYKIILPMKLFFVFILWKMSIFIRLIFLKFLWIRKSKFQSFVQKILNAFKKVTQNSEIFKKKRILLIILFMIFLELFFYNRSCFLKRKP